MRNSVQSLSKNIFQAFVFVRIHFFTANVTEFAVKSVPTIFANKVCHHHLINIQLLFNFFYYGSVITQTRHFMLATHFIF